MWCWICTVCHEQWILKRELGPMFSWQLKPLSPLSLAPQGGSSKVPPQNLIYMYDFPIWHLVCKLHKFISSVNHLNVKLNVSKWKKNSKNVWVIITMGKIDGMKFSCLLINSPRTPLFSNWWHVPNIKQWRPYE